MKELKVEYTDYVKTSFEIECSEIKLVKYKIYGRNNNTDYKLLATKLEKQKAIDYANNLDPKEYTDKLIIEYDKETNSEFPVDLER